VVKHRKLSAAELAHSYDYLAEQFNQERRIATDGVPFEYFVGGGELASAPSGFLGGLAEEWGLQDSRVTEEQFLNLGDGMHAVTGEALVKGSQGSRVRMHELMVSAPKSLSLALAAAEKEQREEIMSALRASTSELVSYIEQTLPLVRRRVGGEEIHEKAAGLIAMSFEHLTSRQTPEATAAGLPLAPQWHSHLQLSNVALRHADKLAADGSRFGAVDSFHVTKEQKLLDCLFQLGVKDRLEALGYRTETTREVEARLAERTGKTVEHSKNRELFIHGITDRDLLLKWSPRTKQVTDSYRSQLEELGITDPDALPSSVIAKIIQKAKIAGRMSKVPPAPDILDQWHRLLGDDGITAETLARAKELGPRHRGKLTKAFIVRQALARLPEVRSAITWAELRGLIGEESLSYGTSRQMAVELARQVWAIEEAKELVATIGRKLQRADELRLTSDQIDELRRAQARSKAEAAALAARFSPELVVLSSASLTTQTQLATEREVVGTIGTWAKAALPAPGAKFASSKAALAVLARDALADEPEIESLSKDQVRALQVILTHRVTVTQGEAGTGKTAVAKVAALAWRKERPHSQVIAVAVSANRAAKFGEGVRADRALTFEKLGEVSVDDDTLFLVDEFAQCDTKRLAKLVKAVGKAHPCLVGIFDQAQLSAIGAGGLVMAIEAATGVKVPPIDGIKRTQDEAYASVWKKLRDPLKVPSAVEWLDGEHLITVVQDKEAAVAEALDIWESERKNAKRRYGVTKAAEARVICSLSNIEVDDISRMAQLRLLAVGELKGPAVAVAWTDPAKPDYRREFDLYQGDTVQITKNFSVKQTGKRIDLTNSDIALVKAANPGPETRDATLELEIIRRGGNVVIELTKPEQMAHLRLHYAGHLFKVQGDSLTVPPVHLYTPGETLESVYMANTRAKGKARTRIVVPAAEVVPDLEDRQREAGGTLDERAEVLKAMTKQWQRVIQDVPAITLARQAGIGQANSSSPSIVLPRMQQKTEMRGLSRAA